MKKLGIIIHREYWSRVKKKSFLITTILVPVLIFGFYAAMIWLSVGNTGKEKKVAVVDESGYFKNKLSNTSSITFSYPNESIDEVKDNFNNSKYSGIVYIPPIDVFKVNDNIKFYSNERIGPGPKEQIVSEIKERVRQIRMKDLQLDEDLLDSLQVDMALQEVSLTDAKSDGEQSRMGSEVLSLLGMVMGFVLYFALLFFGTMVMRGVKEEKTNRIVEVIMSSVKPIQLMFGKILGISFVGLTQFIIWLVIFYGLSFTIGPLLINMLHIDPEVLNNPNVSSEQMEQLSGMEELIVSLANYNYTPLILSFLVYFIGGYLIYASLFSAVGSVVEDDNESQQLVLPIMMPIIISIAIVASMMNDPNSPIAVWSSIFPLTSPIVMPSRIPFNPPTWQIVFSVICLILAVVFFIWISAKIYRTGILMYGKKVTLKSLWRWLRY